MAWTSFLFYVPVLALAGVCHRLSRIVRVPAAALVVISGLALGPTGFDVIAASRTREAHPAIVVHVAVLLGALGYRLGMGMLRLRVLEILRRSLPPLALAAAGLVAGTVLFPILLPGAEPQRSFFRFALPLACVFAAYPLLAVRDLRGPPPANVGSTFLVAVALVGAVYSFTPSLLWGKVDPGLFWRGPVLVLGESGALGVAAAVVHLLLVRKAKLPRGPVGLMLFGLLVEAAVRGQLWLPFTALGFGVALGRAGEPAPSFRGHRWLFAETPFLLVVALSFAPTLFMETAALSSVVVAVALAGFLLAVRARVPGGHELVTGPGLLFLGLTLTVRLDPRMGPLARYTVDFALPAWILLRLVMVGVERRERKRAPARPQLL